MTARYAIYLAPPKDSPLESFARRWLGRDHIAGQPVEQLQIDGITPERLQTITASPRHYGFHATMKAPFELKAGQTAQDLFQTAQSFAAAQQSFAVRLEPQLLKGFLALVPTHPSPALNQLAANCVRHFEPFRAPLSDTDIARRRLSNLTPRQDAQMLAFGYPYIFDDFHFHMTLTQRLADPERSAVLTILQDLTSEVLSEPMPVAEIAIYSQDYRDELFRLRDRLSFEL